MRVEAPAGLKMMDAPSLSHMPVTITIRSVSVDRGFHKWNG